MSPDATPTEASDRKAKRHAFGPEARMRFAFFLFAISVFSKEVKTVTL